MMLCVISYWVLSGAKRRQIQQLRCCAFPAKLLKRRDVYLKLTRHNGRAGTHGTYNPKHNDRSFNLANSEHIDPERAKGNIYWDCYHGIRSASDKDKQTAAFSDVEKMFYEIHYAHFVENQNARNAKIRHTERNRTIEDLLAGKKTCPEETIYQFGTLDEHASVEDLVLVVTEFMSEFHERFGTHVHLLDWALHLDESTPHIHERHVFDCENKYGEIAPQQEKALEALDEKKMPYDILFLDASDAAIRRRYKETRRVHPMTISEGIPVSEAITKERQILQPLRERAKYVIDTSLLSTAQNRERVSSLFLQKGQCAMSINVVSFGFKYGLPQEADIVFDVRCLPNPFYVPELKEKTGLDQEVVDYVMKFPESQELLHRIESFLEYALPLYVKEGKSQLMIAIGCTGGKHRSITFARKIGEYCTKLGYQPSVQHRDARRTA